MRDPIVPKRSSISMTFTNAAESGTPIFDGTMSLFVQSGHEISGSSDARGVIETQHAIYAISEGAEANFVRISRLFAQAMTEGKNFAVYGPHLTEDAVQTLATFRHARIGESRGIKTSLSRSEEQFARAIRELETEQPLKPGSKSHEAGADRTAETIASSGIRFIGRWWFIVVIMPFLFLIFHESRDPSALTFLGGLAALLPPSQTRPRPLLYWSSWGAASTEINRLIYGRWTYAAWDVVAVFLAITLALVYVARHSFPEPVVAGALALDALALFQPIARAIARIGFYAVNALPSLRRQRGSTNGR